MIDSQEKQLRDGVEYIEGLRSAAKQPDRQWGEVKTFSSDRLSSALESSWLVVEVCIGHRSHDRPFGLQRQLLIESSIDQCVPEKIEVKRSILVQLDELAPASTIIASNSSSYPISELIDGLKLSNDGRVLSAHSCKI